MSHSQARIPELEFALVSDIRKQGSQTLLDLIEDCEIMVQGSDEDTYTVIVFPPGYTEELEWEASVEIEFLGFCTEILGRQTKRSGSNVSLATDSDNSTH